MKLNRIAAITALAVSMAVPAFASPSTTGTTGMIDTPTADVLRNGHISVGAYHLDEGNTASVGLGIGDRLEVSGVRTNYDKQEHFNQINAKLVLKNETVLVPGIAVGVEDIGNKIDKSTYAVVTKGLPLGFRLSAGVGDGRFDGMFYSVEKQLVPGLKGVFPDTSLIIENDGHDMNYGLRISVVPTIKLQAGLRDKEPYVGITGSF